MTNIVSGVVSTITELEKDEGWMQGWLKEQPTRLGLGELDAADAATDDDRSFVATDADHCFSVDVQLGEMEASRGFQVLDNWARNRVLHPDKTHVAVLVTEVMSDRYQTTLETLAEHLPLVVVELQVWKGENEAIVVPHIALSSSEIDLSGTPAAKAAEVVAKVADATAANPESETAAEATSESTASEDAPATDEFDDAEAAAEADAQHAAEADAEQPENKDDTGVGNPWGLPSDDHDEQTAGSTGLLTKVK